MSADFGQYSSCFEIVIEEETTVEVEMQYVCVKCRRSMKPEKNGVDAMETVDKRGKPYRIWSADKWRCTNCGFEILAGFAEKPTYSDQDSYNERLKNIEISFY